MIKLQKVKCLKCGYMWAPRVSDPRSCPKCRSTRWDKDDDKYPRRVNKGGE